MNEFCPVCFRRLPPGPQGRVSIAMGSRPLVAVHEGPCLDTALRGVRTIGKGLLYGARELLAKKFPLTSALLEGFAQNRRAAVAAERKRNG